MNLHRMVRQAVRHWRNREQDIGQKCVCVCVCEVTYHVSMLSKDGKVQQLSRTTLKSVSEIWTGHCP